MLNSEAFIYKDIIIISGHILRSDRLDTSALSRLDYFTIQFYCTLWPTSLSLIQKLPIWSSCMCVIVMSDVRVMSQGLVITCLTK